MELLRADLPITAEFNKDLQRTHLETLSQTAQKCGEFFLTVSSLTSGGEMRDFDSLHLIKKCSDRPGLSLKVVRREDKVDGCCGYWSNIVLIFPGC